MKLHKVWIVDDETIIREGLKKHVDWIQLGLEVTRTADCAETALKYIAEEVPDILITDICMKSMDGLNLAQELLERGHSPQVILISSYNDFSYAQRAVRLSAVRDYILKPIDIRQLSSLLEQISKELNSSLACQLQPVSVSMYQTFLQDLRRNGYDRYQMIQCFKSGHSEEALNIWNAAAKTMQLSAASLSIIKRFCLSLILSLISDGLLNESSSAEEDPVKALEDSRDTESIIALCSQILDHICSSRIPVFSSQHSKLIEASLQIIDKEYCNPDFNLTVLASMLNVAPNYLSSRFKEEIGVGFMKYRLEKQMEQAKLLLSNPVYKIYSVSGMVGFLDEKYFSRQFKRYTGDTPKDYRNKRTS